VSYLAEAELRLVNMGFKQMKMQLGAEPTVAREVERVRVLRPGLGDDINLMCDINRLCGVNQAIDIGRRVEPYHLCWLEDVVAHDDFQGLVRVADALTTPIASGEYHYGIRPFRHMLEARSIAPLRSPCFLPLTIYHIAHDHHAVGHGDDARRKPRDSG
jgi:L-alanine-DL-glutamate epimerase-like enolase superfamily enzyme